MQNYLTFDFLLIYFRILILEVLNFKGPLNTSFTLIFGRLPNNTRLVYLNDDILYFSAKEFDTCILPFSKINWIRNRIPKCTLTKYRRQALSKFDPKF